MAAIRVRKTLDSETLHLPELRPLIGRTVEITIEEQTPDVRDEFWAEVARLPENQQGLEAQKAIFRAWRDDPRFQVYWPVLDDLLSRSLEQVSKWVALQGLLPLEDYDYDARGNQAACDREDARSGDAVGREELPALFKEGQVYPICSPAYAPGAAAQLAQLLLEEETRS